MKGRRFALWRWCPQPQNMKPTRSRPAEKPWIPLLASALILSVLAAQGIQMWAPSALNAALPNPYGGFPAVQPVVQPAVQPTFDSTVENTSAAQRTSAVSTEHLTVQLVFPESADPGQAIAISATTTAKANGKITSLSIDVFSYVSDQLVKAASTTILKDKNVRSGDTWQTSLSVLIPDGSVRSVMIGTVTEVWEETVTYYYGTYYYGQYGNQWSSYPPYYPPYPYPSYPYNRTNYYYYPPEPYYVTVKKSSEQTIPLTYVVATTPEYQQLLDADQQLRKVYDDQVAKYNDQVAKYNDLVAKYTNLSSQYDSLRADYDQIVSKYNRLQSDYNLATQDLENYKLATYILIVIAVVLGIALVFTMIRRQPTAHSTTRQRKHEADDSLQKDRQ